MFWKPASQAERCEASEKSPTIVSSSKTIKQQEREIYQFCLLKFSRQLNLRPRTTDSPVINVIITKNWLTRLWRLRNCTVCHLQAGEPGQPWCNLVHGWRPDNQDKLEVSTPVWRPVRRSDPGRNWMIPIHIRDSSLLSPLIYMLMPSGNTLTDRPKK